MRRDDMKSVADSTDAPAFGAAEDGLRKSEDKANHDCLAKRRDGEPMFILLGRDPDAHNIVRLWAERRLAAGGDPEHCQMGLDTSERMKLYAADPANAPASAPPASAYPSLPVGLRAALADLLDACVAEFGWMPDAESGEPVKHGDDECCLKWGHLHNASSALSTPPADPTATVKPCQSEEGA